MSVSFTPLTKNTMLTSGLFNLMFHLTVQGQFVHKYFENQPGYAEASTPLYVYHCSSAGRCAFMCANNVACASFNFINSTTCEIVNSYGTNLIQNDACIHNGK